MLVSTSIVNGLGLVSSKDKIKIVFRNSTWVTRKIRHS